MIRTGSTWEWLPMLAVIEEEQRRREAPLVARIEERQEMYAAAFGEILKRAAEAPGLVADGLDQEAA